MAMCAFECHAGVLLDASMFGRVLQHTDKGGVIACGVMLTAYEALTADDQPAHVFQGSFSVAGSFDEAAKAGGVVKGRAGAMERRRFEAGDDSALRVQATQMVWAKPPGAPNTAPLDGKAAFRPGKSGYVTYTTGLLPMTGLLLDIKAGKPIQVGMRLAKHDEEVIFAGVVEMTKNQRQQLTQCMFEFGERMK